MSVIKEFREFFLRNVKTTTGSKPDQEVGFPVTYVVDGVQRNNRFLKNHVPSENVYKKLFESIPFKLNVEDTATTTTQGLVKVATDLKAYNRENEALGNMRSVIEPHQLVELTNQNILNLTITGDLSIGNPTIINISDVDIVKFAIGGVVTGAGIDVDTKIISIDYNANEIELDKNALSNQVGIVIEQEETDSNISNFSFSGIALTTFKRTLASRFKKAYKIVVARQFSIIVDKATQRLQLDGDVNAPGNKYYYGTNSTGVKGWHPIYNYITLTENAAIVLTATTPILISYTSDAITTLLINYMGKVTSSIGVNLYFGLLLKKNGVLVRRLDCAIYGEPLFQTTTTLSDFEALDVIIGDVVTIELENGTVASLVADVKMVYKKS